MNEEQRPGGLTALAVLNFVFSAWGFLGLLGMIALFAFIGRIPTDQMDEAQKAQFEALQDVGVSVWVLIVALSIVSNILLLVSGIGYLKQKKIMGRMVGNGYAILSIVTSIASGMMFAAEMGGGFNIGTMIGLIYPLVTLFLLNVTFADDFTN
jgi:hypothetical protein